MWLIALILVGFLGWLFVAPLQILIDTRKPWILLRWFTVAMAMVLYEDEKWLLRIQVLFFRKEWEVEKLLMKMKQKESKTKRKKRRGAKKKSFSRLIHLVKTFRVKKWEIAIDTGDNPRNAWLYPLNFYPVTRRHLFVNFVDENYVIVDIRNAPWKLVYALIK